MSEGSGPRISESSNATNNTGHPARPVLEVRPEWMSESTLAGRSTTLSEWRSGGSSSLGLTRSRLRMAQSISSMTAASLGDINNCMLHPQSIFCLFWDLINIVFILYELFITPVQVFVVPSQRLLPLFDPVAAVFWTADICLTFMRAKYINSEIEWDFRRVAKNYFKTWFAFDLLVVLPDWFSVILGGMHFDAMAFLRVMRMLKLMRLMRVAKMDRVLRGVLQRFNQTYILHFIKILRLVACILMVNHCLACVWYRLGCSFDDGWAKASLESDPVFGYWTALHWSLTQFHGSMEINPGNLFERMFAVGVVLLALIGFSHFLSSLTDMMIQLQNLRHKKTRQQSALRAYLTENNISEQTSINARRYFEFEVETQQRQVQQLAVLQTLPRNLLMDVYYEARAPVLCSHTLFLHFRSDYPRAMRMVCHDAVSPLPVHNGEVIFTTGDACSRALFVDQGTVTYSLSRAMKRSRRKSADKLSVWKLRKGDWICEVALWTVWENVGTMVSPKHALLLEVDAEKFAASVRHFVLAHAEAVIYSRDFLSELNASPFPITDLDLRFEDAENGRPRRSYNDVSSTSSQEQDSFTHTRMSLVGSLLGNLGGSAPGSRRSSTAA